MYEELFQTADRPFRATPDVRFYFPFESMEQARQNVLRAVRRAEGPAVVMGNVGLGKTLLSQVIADDLGDRFDVVRLHATRLCSRRALLQNILFELQLPYRDLSEGELRLSLMERMEPSPSYAADGLVFIVDEAHTLPIKLIEELRLITNFARQGQSRARLVLVGSLQLEETFALPELNSFNQRIAARCFLHPMNRKQTADFIRHQFNCVHLDAKSIITADAIENVFIASDGVPRLVNQVMDHALILAIANGQMPISAALIQEAWSDLQQLPVSFGKSAPAVASEVEFGFLEDLDTDTDGDFEIEHDEDGVVELDALTRPTPTQPIAFTTNLWPSVGDLEDFGPEPTGNDADMLILDEDDEPSTPATPVKNIFAAWQTPSRQIEIEFTAQPSMQRPEPTNRAPAPAATAAALPPAGNPFGEDFDEEFTIAAEDIKRWQRNQRQSQQRAATAASQGQPAPIAQVAPAGQHTAAQAAATVAAQVPPANTVQANAPTQFAAQPAAAIEPISISTLPTEPVSADAAFGYESAIVAAAANSPEALQQEIEDIISQLNFSAFSVEAASVEHISPEFQRGPVASPDIADRPGQVEDTYRVYPLHSEEEIEEINITLLNDDRDLLMIEEEIPASMRLNMPQAATSSARSSAAPVATPPSYPELFQQLRS